MGKKKQSKTDSESYSAEMAEQSAVEGAAEELEESFGTPNDSESEYAEIIEDVPVNSIEDELNEKIVSLESELADAHDLYLRQRAETENIRKQNLIEVDKARKYSIRDFAKSLVDVAEVLDKACEVGKQSDSTATIESIQEGVELTRKKLLDAFSKAQINRIDPELGSAFDHNLHEAISVVPTDEMPPNHIFDVFRPGYSIHDQLIRGAMVVVSASLVEPAEPATKNEDENPS